MKIEESSNSGRILIDCLHCGIMYSVPDFRGESFSGAMQEFYERNRICPDCEEAEHRKKQQAAEEQKKKASLSDLPRLLESCGIEFLYSHDRVTGELFSVPPCRYAAEWIYRNRNRNLLVSGITGSGKSTSATFLAVSMIREGKNVFYTSLRKILAKWRSSKTNEKRPSASEDFLQELFSKDLLIIDEVIGKARVSESGQEFLFELLESINSGSCRAKVWLLGNFYEGSIEELFSDPEPVRRRLSENFVCVYLNKKEKTVTPISVWKE